MDISSVRRMVARLLKLVMGLAVAVAVAGIALNEAFAWFAVLAGAGGVLMALFFKWSSRRHAPPTSVPDSFSRDAFSTDTVNFAHVRVAGVGGLGLVLVAAAVTFDFPLATVVVLSGLVGGLVAAGVAIVLRRKQGPLPSSTEGPGARAVLFAEPRPQADVSTSADPDRQRQAAVAASV
jgi:hypothetical protein